MIPQPKPAWEPLESVQAFTTYATQDAAATAGAPGAKDYLSKEDEKGWYDPDADKEGAEKVHFEVAGSPWVAYQHAFLGKMDANQDGIVGVVAMSVANAKRVNIKPTGVGMTNVPGTGRVTPVPMKGPLASTQRIRRPNPLTGFQVRNLDVPLPEEEAQQTTQGILAALADLAAKVSKIMAKLGI